jgi:hypothetical protein
MTDIKLRTELLLTGGQWVDIDSPEAVAFLEPFMTASRNGHEGAKNELNRIFSVLTRIVVIESTLD